MYSVLQMILIKNILVLFLKIFDIFNVENEIIYGKVEYLNEERYQKTEKKYL